MADEKDLKPSPTFVPGRCGVVSLGLMGGSFAKAFAAAGAEVFAWNRTRSTLELAMIETVAGELDEETITTCELIVLAGSPHPPSSGSSATRASSPPAPSSSTPWA